MKIVCISDTHGYTPEIPDGDVLVHSGDYTQRQSSTELDYFVYWFRDLPHKHKILVPGNHDRVFEDSPEYVMSIVMDKFHVLIDNEIVIEGIKFYGTPSQPVFYNWAFNHSERIREEKYSLIPEDTDVLITHTPPFTVLDFVRSIHVGCPLLLERVKKVKPKYHVFGHIHEGYGTISDENTTFVNSSICDDNYRPINQPVIVEIKEEDGSNN